MRCSPRAPAPRSALVLLLLSRHAAHTPRFYDTPSAASACIYPNSNPHRPHSALPIYSPARTCTCSRLAPPTPAHTCPFASTAYDGPHRRPGSPPSFLHIPRIRLHTSPCSSPHLHWSYLVSITTRFWFCWPWLYSVRFLPSLVFTFTLFGFCLPGCA
ncbi:hypothetical protein VTO73DRAFT_14961 [Trametes versicolor]